MSWCYSLKQGKWYPKRCIHRKSLREKWNHASISCHGSSLLKSLFESNKSNLFFRCVRTAITRKNALNNSRPNDHIFIWDHLWKHFISRSPVDNEVWALVESAITVNGLSDTFWCRCVQVRTWSDSWCRNHDTWYDLNPKAMTRDLLLGLTLLSSLLCKIYFTIHWSGTSSDWYPPFERPRIPSQKGTNVRNSRT
jgi:hypothetical protein